MVVLGIDSEVDTANVVFVRRGGGGVKVVVDANEYEVEVRPSSCLALSAWEEGEGGEVRTSSRVGDEEGWNKGGTKAR